MSDAAPGFATKPEYLIEFEPSRKRVKVVFNGVTVADSHGAVVMRETRLPPVFYLPRKDVRMDLARPSEYRTHCPFKGNASYWSLAVGDAVAENSLWSYETPQPEAAPIKDYIGFYRNRMDAWFEDEQEVSIDPVTDTHAHGNPLVDWLMRDAWEASSISELVARLARQLLAAGVPVERINLLVRTLHPQVMGTVHIWIGETDEVEKRPLSHASAAEQLFLSSPLVPILEGRGGVRRRLEGPEAQLDFPILRDLHEQGMTDYVAMPLTFSDGQRHVLTLATKYPGGFATENLGHIHEILPLVSRLVEVHAMRHTAKSLLDTYLGAHTGERVLDGLIKRGDGEDIPAVVWWCDLRGSTSLAERMPRQEYLHLLNDFFECAAGSVIERGGEVLKFIGDAVMAIFPLARDPDADDDAPERALAATRDTLERLERLNDKRTAQGEKKIGIALALHQGEVTYGNVGVAGRLDFTVTGPAVNEVARLESLSKKLGTPVVASANFARLIGGELVSLGHHGLRGVRAEHEVFTLREGR